MEIIKTRVLKTEKQEVIEEKKLPLFIRDLKFGKSPASVKKLNREFEQRS